MRHKNLYEEAVSFYGVELQETLWHEEVGELMQALSKHKRNPSTKTKINVIEEIADVILMTEQLASIYGTDLVETFIKVKSDRLRKRIDKAREIIIDNHRKDDSEYVKSEEAQSPNSSPASTSCLFE